MIPSEPNLLEITTMKLNQLALAAAFLAVPFMAPADLRSLDDAALAGISGQDGISIAGDFNGTIGAIVYRDSDASGTGTLRLENVSMTGFRDRKSTRLNSSHVKISYAVFCLKKKKQMK